MITVGTGAVSTTIPVGQGPSGVAFSPDGTQAYVTNSLDNSVSVIATGLAPMLLSMAVAPSRASAQVGTVVMLTAEGYSSTRQNSATDLGPVSPVYTTDPSGEVSGSSVRFAKAGTYTITATLRKVVASTTVKVVTGEVSNTITVGRGPNGVAVSPDGSQIFVPNSGDNTVSVIAVDTGTVSTTIPVGQEPDAVAVSPDGTQAYVANCTDNSVSVIATGLAPVVVPTAVVSMAVVPSRASAPAGTVLTLTAEGYRSTRQNSATDLGPVSPVYSTDSNGVISGSTVRFTKAGKHTLTATLRRVTASTTVTVTPGSFAAMTLSPAAPSVIAGAPVSLTARGADPYGNDLGPVSPTYSTDSNGVVSGSTVRFTQAGTHTLTATLRGVTASTTVTVTPAALASITISPPTATVKKGASLTFTTTGYDRFGNTRGLVTGDSVFTSSNRGDTVRGSTVRFGNAAGRRTITGTHRRFTATSAITE